MYGLHHLGTLIFGAEAEFLGHNVDGLRVEALVNRHHYAQIHAGAYHLVNGHVHHRRQVIGRNELGEF